MAGVVVVGSLNVDHGFRMPSLPRPGETVLATDRSRTFGGKGGNQAIAAATRGAEVRFVGAVGDDRDGVDYLAHLADHGVDIAGVATALGEPTGTAMVLIDDGGENLIVVDPGANATVTGPDALRHVVADDPAVVLFQLEIPIPAVEAIAQALPPTTTVVLNPAPMPADPQVLAATLPHVDILVPNRSELGALVGLPEPRTRDEVTECLRAVDGRITPKAARGDADGADEVGAAGPRGFVVVATLGADGAAIRAADGAVEFVPTAAVDVVDTTGAGDAFCGCLAAEIASGHSVRDAVVTALEVASYSTTVHGAQLPKRAVSR